jgi:Tfp pilus assembly protein PilO
MLLQAVPPIPEPPSIPFDPNMIASSLDSPAVVMIVLLVMTACTIVLWPLARALARRLEGRGGQDAALRSEVEQLQHRLGEVDQLQVRVAELEERLDFAERLLAAPQEPERQNGR